jgi:hypothetical protein
MQRQKLQTHLLIPFALSPADLQCTSCSTTTAPRVRVGTYSRAWRFSHLIIAELGSSKRLHARADPFLDRAWREVAPAPHALAGTAD